MKYWILLFALCAITDAKLYNLLRRKMEFLRWLNSLKQLSTASFQYPSIHVSQPHAQYVPLNYHVPVPTSILNTQVPLEPLTSVTTSQQLSSNPVIVDDDDHKDQSVYLLQPIEDNSPPPPQHTISLEYGPPTVLQTHVLPEEVLVEQTFHNNNEVEPVKYHSPIIHVGADGHAYPVDKQEYTRSYELDDGTQVHERGKLVTKDGSTVLVKDGYYQYKRSDGQIVTVNWTADENGFKIVR